MRRLSTSSAILLAFLQVTLTLAHDEGTPLGLTKVNFARSSGHEAVRSRVAYFKSRGNNGGITTVLATNLAFEQYTTRIGVGSPPTMYSLIIDTGSSNTFVGAGKEYIKTRTSIPTGDTVNVTYGSGFFTGKEFLDQVTLAPGLVIHNQSIGDAIEFADFQGVDGIIGFGPTALTLGTLPHAPLDIIPTVQDNMGTQGLVNSRVLGVAFAPASVGNISDTNGALTFGGVNKTKFTGEIVYAPVTQTQPAGSFWGVNITRATVGNTTEIIPRSTAGIVDTGTTQILLADDFFSAYLAAIPGATFSTTSGLLTLPASSANHVRPLAFTIGGRSWSLNAAAQLVPVQENAVWGVNSTDVRVGYVGPLGAVSGEGLDFVLGQKFMERFYTVFDSDKGRIGFAETKHTFET